jgi:hypothetical protein
LETLLFGGIWFLLVGVIGFVARAIHRKKAATGYRFTESREFAWARRIHPLLPESERYWEAIQIVVPSVFLLLGIVMIILASVL